MIFKKFLLFCVLFFLLIRSLDLVSGFLLNAGYVMLNHTQVLGNNFISHDQHVSAKKFFQASSTNLTNTSSIRGLGFVLLSEGKDTEALNVWTQTASVMENEMLLWGDIALESNNYSSAIKWYKKALELNQGVGMCSIYERLSQAYEFDNDLIQARTYLSKCIQTKELYPEAFAALCFSYLDTDEVDEAISLFENSIFYIQKDSSMLTCIGKGYMQKGAYEKALNYFQEAIVTDPNRASLYQWASLAYTRLGIYDQAIINSEKAIILDDDEIDYWRHLANLYKEIGQDSAALNAQEKISNLGSQEP